MGEPVRPIYVPQSLYDDVLADPQLRVLAENGSVVAVAGLEGFTSQAAVEAQRERFAEFMRDDVFWIGDPEFDKAWRDLTGDTTMPEVGYTKPTPEDHTQPGYINAQPGDGEMVVTVRGDALKGAVVGHTVQLRVPLGDWDQFVASVTQMRGQMPEPADPAQPALGLEEAPDGADAACD